MAVFDTHRAFQALKDAGFSERQAEALIDVGSEGYGALATKDDLKALEQATKDNLMALEQATKDNLMALEQATKADIAAVREEMATRADLKALEQATKADLKDLELRLTPRLGALIVGAAGVLAILDFLP